MKEIQIITSALEMKNFATQCKLENKTIGFVPTMGALHIGHISLINSSVKRCDVTVVSIFVNPTQFNNPDDLKKYPRTFDTDKTMLETTGCDVIFFPSINEMYPDGLVTTQLDLQGLDKVMEGEHRPGHFAGVVTIVKSLFEMVNPDVAFFGEKDFQQLAIIKFMTIAFNMPLEIVPCHTVREKDGLAFSSRNIHLTPDERKDAPLIYNTISQCKNKKLTMTVYEAKAWATNRINSSPYLKVEYIEFVNSKTLQPLNSWDECEEQRVCTAVTVSKTRLIDNAML
jgi:pantoate--beta-alanine ligase